MEEEKVRARVMVGCEIMDEMRSKKMERKGWTKCNNRVGV